MISLNSRHYWLLAAALCTTLCTTGCGKQEHTEAVQLAKALKGKKTNFDGANTTEKDFIGSARAWCGGITTNGAGRGTELKQNSAVAAGLAKSAVAISAQLSQVREAIDAVSLTAEYPKTVRNELTTQLTKRQRMLQDMRALLEQAAPQFLEYGQSKAYKGDTYPDGVGKVNAMLSAYKPPDDALGTALAALQAKYSLSDSEL
jgi:hypothetical protein